MEKEDEQQQAVGICMDEEEEEMEWVQDEEDDELEEEEDALLDQPADWSLCQRIEKMAAVVAWTPSADLFLNHLMLGDPEFEFMLRGHAHHAYYWHRIAVLRRRPRLLYSKW